MRPPRRARWDAARAKPERAAPKPPRRARWDGARATRSPPRRVPATRASARRGPLGVLACAALAVGCGGGGPADGQPPRVVPVSVTVEGLVPRASTGVALGNGRVLTVAHGVAGARAVVVASRRARVLHASRRLDLAVLAVPGLRAPTVRLGGDTRAAALAVLRHGARRTLMASVRRRVVVRFRAHPGDPARVRPGLELAAQVDPGDSGAPVLDRHGRLLGIVYARSRDHDGTAWAVDASAVRALLAP